jgi:hypothetical protein
LRKRFGKSISMVSFREEDEVEEKWSDDDDTGKEEEERKANEVTQGAI